MSNKYDDVRFEKWDVAFGIAMLITGFLFWELITAGGLGLGIVVFTGIITTLSGIYLGEKGYRQNKRSLVCLGLIVISAAEFLVFDSNVEKRLNCLFIMALFIYWIALTTGRTLEDKLSIYIEGDALEQLICTPFANFGICGKILMQGAGNREEGKKKRRPVVAALAGILIMIPVLAVVTALLASADAAFMKLMEDAGSLFSQRIGRYILEFIVGIPVACYLCGLIWGNAKGTTHKRMSKEGCDKVRENIRFAPGAAVIAGLSALNLVYVVFFISQAGYLFSAMSDSIPSGFTYAEYARRGFFELCIVVAINLAVTAVAHVITGRKGQEVSKALKAETVVISVFTIMLAVTGISKMIMYIDRYGLTQLRVYTSWFMILILAVFLIVMLRQIKVFNASRAVIIVFAICFMVLCWSNVDGQIVKYNTARYEKGDMEMSDLMSRSSVGDLTDGAVPYLKELYDKADDPAIKARLYTIITGDYGNYREVRGEGSWKSFNLQRYRADKIRRKLVAENSGKSNGTATLGQRAHLLDTPYM